MINWLHSLLLKTCLNQTPFPHSAGFLSHSYSFPSPLFFTEKNPSPFPVPCSVCLCPQCFPGLLCLIGTVSLSSDAARPVLSVSVSSVSNPVANYFIYWLLRSSTPKSESLSNKKEADNMFCFQDERTSFKIYSQNKGP